MIFLRFPILKILLFAFICMIPLESHGKEDEIQFCGEVRVNLIKGWDKLLTWTLKPKIKPYFLASPLVQNVYIVNQKDILEFDQQYGFYSASCPIVGVVTKDQEHIRVTNAVLESLSEIHDKNQRKFTEDEILAKVMAYRYLERGMKIHLSDGVYIVDEIIDLWRGMPAFGLVPMHPVLGPPILLFRGTDMNLISEKGWASILSDLDTTGPGHATFLKAREDLHNWLEKVKKLYSPARCVGYSLGGAFVFYTLTYEPELLNTKFPSVAYNPPGISLEVYEKWKIDFAAKQVPLRTYINQGDIVSQIGFFLSSVWEASLEKQMDIIQSHVTLISAQPRFKLSEVDVTRENRSRM